MKNAVFLIQTADCKGLISQITSFFFENSLNIVHCQQYTAELSSHYFMRIKIDLSDMQMSRRDLEGKFGALAEELQLDWQVHYSDYVPKVAILVTKTSHNLHDLLVKHQEGELHCEIPLIISNHPNLEYMADWFRIPFYCLAVTKETKQQQEAKVLDLLEKHRIDLVIMARYMQILSEEFIAKFPLRIINIHHAFLPAFEGGNPYVRAYERGVKMIGATAHYATAELDKGPIIEQDVVRIDHEKTPDDLKRIGAEVERVVLTRAVKAHLEHRVMVHGHRVILFN
jgi:formyltetrahydrofolate deformylase